MRLNTLLQRYILKPFDLENHNYSISIPIPLWTPVLCAYIDFYTNKCKRGHPIQWIWKAPYGLEIILDKVWLQTLLLSKATTLFNIFLLDVNFDKSMIGLYFLLISSILAKFSKDQRSIAISSINCFNYKIV